MVDATYNKMLKSFGITVNSGFFGQPPFQELPVDCIHVLITGPKSSRLGAFTISGGDMPDETLKKIYGFVAKYPFSTDVDRKMSYILCKGPIVTWDLFPKKDEDVDVIYNTLFPERKPKAS